MEIERDRFGAPDDTAILPWYNGAYTHGFVALHPFFTVEGLDPKTCEYGTLILEGSAAPDSLGLLEWGDQEAADRRIGKEIGPDGVDVAAKRYGRPVLWRTICQQIGFGNHCDVDQALRTGIGGLRHDLADAAKFDRLASYCSEHRIFAPNEGRFEPLMQTGLAAMFRRAGYDSLVVGDEFGDDDCLMSVNQLQSDELWDDLPELQFVKRRLIAPDRSLLASVHWDSFYTLVLGTKESFRGLQISRLFEGFWCSDTTKTYWLTQPCIPLVE